MNFKEKFEIYKLKPLAIKDNNEACLRIAKLYLDDKRYEDAYDMFLISASRNDAMSYFWLGELNYEKQIKNATDDDAFKYFQKAYNLGFKHALFRIAGLYFYGRGCEFNPGLALKYFLECAQNKYGSVSDSIINIGTIYLNGDVGEKPNLSYALQCYETAWKKYQNPAVLNVLGNLYLRLEYYRDAKACFLIAQNQFDDAEAIFNLGLMYYFGQEVTQSYHKARHYFETASKRDVIEAKGYLIKILYEGLDDKEIDYHRAYKLALEIYPHKNVFAIYYLGKFYENGIIVEQDLSKAITFYKEASEQQYEPATTKLKELLPDFESSQNIA